VCPLFASNGIPRVATYGRNVSHWRPEALTTRGLNTINTKKHSLKGYFPTSVKGLKSRRTEEGEKDVLKGGEEKKLGEEQRTGMRSHSLIG